MPRKIIAERSAKAPGYGGVAKGLHWLILALLAVQFVFAWTMPDVRPGMEPETLTNLHLSTGALILLLVVLRALWRLTHPVPLLSDGTPPWQNRIAAATHFLLYFVLFVTPILGWADASARGWSVTLYGTVALPPILAKGSSLLDLVSNLHSFCAYALMTLVGLHAAAALYHHFWLRDRVLERMLPGKE